MPAGSKGTAKRKAPGAEAGGAGKRRADAAAAVSGLLALPEGVVPAEAVVAVGQNAGQTANTTVIAQKAPARKAKDETGEPRHKRRNWPKKILLLLEKLDNIIRRNRATPLAEEEFKEGLPNSLRAHLKFEDLASFPLHNLQYGKTVIDVSPTSWTCNLCNSSHDGTRLSKVYKHLCSKKHKVRLLARIAQYGPNTSQFGNAATQIRNPYCKKNFIEYLGQRGVSGDEAETQFLSEHSVATKRQMISDQLCDGVDKKFKDLEQRFWEEHCAVNQRVVVFAVRQVLSSLSMADLRNFLNRQMFKYRSIEVITDEAKLAATTVALHSYLTYGSMFEGGANAGSL